MIGEAVVADAELAVAVSRVVRVPELDVVVVKIPAEGFRRKVDGGTPMLDRDDDEDRGVGREVVVEVSCGAGLGDGIFESNVAQPSKTFCSLPFSERLPEP